MMRRSTQQFAIVLALFLSATAGGQVIRLRADAVVDAPVVCLADVAQITISQDGKMSAIGRVLVARAPRVGAKKRLTLYRIEDRLERLGYDLSALLLTGSRVCVVTRSASKAVAKTVAAEESGVDAVVSASASAIPLAQRRTLEQAIRQYLIGRAKQGGEALQVDFRSTDRMLLRLTESVGRFAISTRQGRTLGAVPLTIDIPVAEGKAQHLKITAEVYLLQQQVVARRALGKGRVLTAADVQVVSQRVTRPDDRIATALKGVVGTVISSPLAAGDAVRLDRLKRPALIRRGDAVTVVYLRGRLSVKTIAWATRDAALGEQVTLRSARRSKKTFSAVCTGPRSAKIDFGHVAGSGRKGNCG